MHTHTCMHSFTQEHMEAYIERNVKRIIHTYIQEHVGPRWKEGRCSQIIHTCMHTYTCTPRSVSYTHQYAGMARLAAIVSQFQSICARARISLSHKEPFPARIFAQLLHPCAYVACVCVYIHIYTYLSLFLSSSSCFVRVRTYACGCIYVYIHTNAHKCTH
jgi:hypothetical protein